MSRNLPKKLLLALALCIAPALAACGTPSAAAVAASIAPTVAPTKAPETEITVLAASSLTEAFAQIAKDFTAANPTIKVTLSFAGSQECVAQITAGAKADIFASASKSYMDTLISKDFVSAEAVKAFAGNKLVVVCRKALEPVPVFADLGTKKLLIVIADETVPVGKYTLAMLEKITKAGTLSGFADMFKANVVSRETNVKMVLQKVQLGEADCGVVYTTDALAADQSKIVAIDVPAEYNVPASYPAAVLRDSANADAAKLFLDYILSDSGQAALQKFGFTKP